MGRHEAALGCKEAHPRFPRRSAYPLEDIWVGFCPKEHTGRMGHAFLRQWSMGPELDFVQLRSIAERFSEALQQCAWNLNHLGRLLGRGKMDMLPQLPPHQGKDRKSTRLN